MDCTGGHAPESRISPRCSGIPRRFVVDTRLRRAGRFDRESRLIANASVWPVVTGPRVTAAILCYMGACTVGRSMALTSSCWCSLSSLREIGRMRSPKTAMSQPRSPGRRLLGPPPRGGHVLVVCRGGRIGWVLHRRYVSVWCRAPTWIDRGRSAIRAVRPGYASPSFWALTGGPPGHDPPSWSPSQAVLTDRRPEPDPTPHAWYKERR